MPDAEGIRRLFHGAHTWLVIPLLPVSSAKHKELVSIPWNSIAKLRGHEGASDGGIEFWGGSFVADPFGRIIAKASHNMDEVLVVPCDPALAETTRRHWPFLRDRRIDAYGQITERYLG